jgi:hypothetical protein
MSAVVPTTSTVAAVSSAASKLWAAQRKFESANQAIISLSGGSNAAGTHYGAPADYSSVRSSPLVDQLQALKTIRGQAGLAAGDAPVNVSLALSHADIAASEETCAKMQLAQFDDWVGRSFKPFSNPANHALLEQIYPEYFKARVDAVVAANEIQTRLKTIEIAGIKSLSDLHTLFLKQTNPAAFAELAAGALGMGTVDGMEGHIPLPPRQGKKRITYREWLRWKAAQRDGGEFVPSMGVTQDDLNALDTARGASRTRNLLGIGGY